MELNEYQKQAMNTCMKTCDNPLYMLFEIASEAGELQGKFAKAIRGNEISFNGGDIEYNQNLSDYTDWMKDVLHEMGDILWGIAGLAQTLGISLDIVAKMNIEKLASRKQRGVIEGNGDNR